MDHDGDEAPPRKDETARFLRAWAWKREHRWTETFSVSLHKYIAVVCAETPVVCCRPDR